MEKEGKYIYCVIGTKGERNFGAIGLGESGAEVLTIGYDDLSMVVSNHPLNKVTISRANMLAHEKVIEKVMEEYDAVLPVRFGTIAASVEEIRNLLDRRRREFTDVLRAMNHKVELGVKGLWMDRPAIFQEITEENKNIKKLKAELQAQKGKKDIQAAMSVGKMVAEELEAKREKEAQAVVDELKGTAVDYKLNKTIGDEMFINAVFLVDKGREKEFDNIMEELGNKHKSRVRFMYAGPLPPYNFVNLAIYPESWEV
ncbi:GvpL/GvpF family gas vesicle protein [Candidatus Saganbacteria bacterium]|nr:GvpL/GvpF family gas vesicle protein [Candidatus Saganbacteria bacterium]